MKWAWILAAVATSLMAMPLVAATFNYEARGDAGAVVVGTFGYDEAVSDSDSVPDSGFYRASGFLTATVSGGALHGLVVNERLVNWLVSVFEFEHALETFQMRHQLTLLDTSAHALPNDRLPKSLELNDFATRTLTLVGTSTRQFTLTRIVKVLP